MSKENVMKLIKDHEVKYVDLRFTDTIGKEQHVTIPASVVDDAFFNDGKMFDGSSISGWRGIDDSDMVLMPETDTAVIDPFYDDPTVNIRCDVLVPTTMQGYERDPRSLAKRAEAYLQSTGIADTAYFGPEPEFFIFDDVRWSDNVNSAFYEIDSDEGCWNSDTITEDKNIGHRPGVKGGYFPVPPVDSQQNIRSAMCTILEEMGVTVEVHHHEVATAGQAEIGTRFDTLLKRADQNMILKYVVLNVAHAYGKTMVTVCTYINHCLRMVKICFQVTNMVACRKQLCTILAVSLNTHEHLTHLQMPAPIATNVWSQASRLQPY